jgi:hypothetical protein
MKRLIIILSVLAIVLLTGCEPSSSTYTTNNNMSFTEIYSEAIHDDFYYMVDNNTKVIYIVYYGRGITVAYNADGTVMTEKDIKK